MGWFSSKKHPEYWEKYCKTFLKKKSISINETRFVVFDTETTGLLPKKDKLLSIGAVTIINNRIKVKDCLEIFLEQAHFNNETVPIHGILKNGIQKKVTQEESVKLFLDYVGNAVLVGHHIRFDILMINQALKELQLPNLKNKVVDTALLYPMLLGKPQHQISLDDLCKNFNIAMHDRHNALGDAYLTALVFIKIVNQLKKEKTNLRVIDLFSTAHNKLY